MEEIKSPLLEVKPKKEHYGGYVAAFSILSILLLLGLALPVRDARACGQGMRESSESSVLSSWRFSVGTTTSTSFSSFSPPSGL